MFTLTHNSDKPIRLWMAHKLFIVFNQPDACRVLLNSEHTMDRADFFNFVDFFFGDDGLLTSAGEN